MLHEADGMERCAEGNTSRAKLGCVLGPSASKARRTALESSSRSIYCNHMGRVMLRMSDLTRLTCDRPSHHLRGTAMQTCATMSLLCLTCLV